MGRLLVAIGFVGTAVLAYKAGREAAVAETPVIVAHADRQAALPAVFTQIARADDEPIEEVEVINGPHEIPTGRTFEMALATAPSEDEGDGLTDEQRWEGQVAQLEDKLAPRLGAIHGDVRDARSGERLAGVTVIVTSAGLTGAQTAITDEQGYFEVANLPPNTDYLATFYYADLTVERAGLAVSPDRATPVFQKLEQDLGPREPIIITHDGYTEAVGDVIVVTNTITGIEDQNNVYVVDQIDTTGLTFGGDQ